MIYCYRCTNADCATEFEVIKSVAEIDRPEKCEKCGLPAGRYIGRTHFYGASDWDKAEWNPGLGMVTRNARHRKDEAKARGMEEIGNESPDKMHDHFEKQRKEKYDQVWADDREKTYT